MLAIDIILVILIGLSIIELVCPSASFIEKAGLSFLTGIFSQTILLVLLDALNIPLTRLPILSVTVILWLILCAVLYKKGYSFKSFNEYKNLLIKQVCSINVVWLAFIVVIVYVEYMNFSKCMYFPTFDRDSLAGFDTIGYVIAQESNIKNLSIFDIAYNPGIHGPGSYISYAPFVQLGYAIAYIFGAETSKIISALMFLFFLLAFYGILARSIKKTGAAIITLLVMLTPEMLAFSSMSATNVMHAIFASLGTIYGIRWLDKGEKGDMLISSIMLSANAWTRSEGVIFIAAIGFLALIKAVRKHSIKQLILWGVIAVLPFFLWSVYQRIFGLTSESIMMTSPFYDQEKIDLIIKNMFNHFLNVQYYGWTFKMLMISFVLNIWFIVKKKDNLYGFFALIISIFLYMLVLYQIDYKWDTINNVLAYSAKRFIFCFVPLAWYYLSTNKVISYPLEKLEDLLTFQIKSEPEVFVKTGRRR
ncbi:MAG: glycosyltransferase family 39 protein [Bacteroidales bacterium]|nr:glycosyltransferase family 39 protein [Bacteroidales bacterium]